MKIKIAALVLASALVLALAGPVSAGTNETRTVATTFNFPAVGLGNLGGRCLGPQFVAPQLHSCMVVTPAIGEDHVSVTVTDSSGTPVYITIRQDGNSVSESGCGTIEDFPINDLSDVKVIPWAGPGHDGEGPCLPGSLTLAGGSGFFTFYDDVPSGTGRSVNQVYNFPGIGHGDVGGLCLGPDFDVPELDSCVQATPASGEDHVSVSVIDNNGVPVYFSIQQDGRSATGCGFVEEYPIDDTGPGGTAAGPVTVIPWAGPSLDGHCFPGSTNLGGGTVTFSFHDDVP